ncbi:GntR family transcriptional regulator [Cryobacterium psychrophilum]|uniref:GntR family transcriptional regulator n=1 Tax=Cryobacterium psychrophilum TaxID=41988 RepID=UPI0014170E55|nr:GntR family transcriptional regulator [Cryobacterium psychrophilum]
MTDQVSRLITQAIHDGTLAPATMYSIVQLADELGVSRSPVREALLRMAEAGIVRIERNRGFSIVRPLARDVVEIFAIRLALEVYAVGRVSRTANSGLASTLRDDLRAAHQRAAECDEEGFFRHDFNFHDHILEAAGNDRARNTVLRLRETMRILGPATTAAGRSLAAIEAEHEPIITGITDGNAAAAMQAMMEHLTHTGLLLTQHALRLERGTTAEGSTDDDSDDVAGALVIWHSLIG